MRLLKTLLFISISGSLNAQKVETLNLKDDGYRGIWYFIGKTNDEYTHKYSGGLGTYPANHYPFSIYAPSVDKTFFCYGGASKAEKPSLLHEVGYFDHKSKRVSRPTIILDKQTEDAHDNPVMSIDKEGYIWIFSTSHGVERPSYIHKSSKPYDIESFELISATYLKNGKSEPFNNFSYLQIYYNLKQGFFGLMTHYERGVLKYGNNKPRRTIGYITSADGITWSEIKDLGVIQEGHYQSSGVTNLSNGDMKIVSVFNYHPDTENGAGLDYRTNIYYLETINFGETWQNGNGKTIQIPLVDVQNDALVNDAEKESKLVFINDVAFDEIGNAMISYITSKGPNPGPQNGPHEFMTTFLKQGEWQQEKVTNVDHNYDYGSLYYHNGNWQIIAPTGNTPFSFNNGGELETWKLSKNDGKWMLENRITQSSQVNHSYPRKPINFNSNFYAFWADGNPREQSISNLYFSNQKGEVFKLPYKFKGNMFKVKKQ